MAFGIAILIAAIIGIIYGVTQKNKSLAILSGIVMIITIAVWVYFYLHPY